MRARDDFQDIENPNRLLYCIIRRLGIGFPSTALFIVSDVDFKCSDSKFAAKYYRNMFYCSIIFPPSPRLYITQSRYSSAISTPLEPSFFQ